jgi:SAM-dependent methyltransferase
MTHIVDNSEYWAEIYAKDSAGWNLRSAAPVFLDLLSNDLLKNKKSLLILGCGYGYDAVAAAKMGFEVTAIDFSESAINFAEKLASEEGVKVNFLVEDIFKLGTEFKNQFDAVYDYVTYCAINPARRKEYAEKISTLIKSTGLFLIILFPIENRDGGPPFAVDPAEAEQFFSQNLELILSTAKINSVKPRKGRELLQIYIKN